MRSGGRVLLAIGLALLLLGSIVSCAPTPVSTPSPPPTAPEEGHEEVVQAIPWNEAKYHIGERITVYGPVVSTKYASSSKGTPTFLNIGKAYPDPNRFTVVIWGDCRLNFPEAPEVYYRGRNISVTGLIIEYNGVPEIEICYPYQIQQY